jgi:pilus assembly protein CpaC
LRTRRARTGLELRNGQSFALAGLLDNSETQSLSKVPGLGDIPIIGNLFRSKQFQKNESELMFIVTAHVVKPVNRDDLPALPNVDNLKKGSLLGLEKKDSNIDGPTGFITDLTKPSSQPTAPTKTVTPAAAPAIGEALKSLPRVSAVAVPTAGSATKVNPDDQ